MDAHATHLDSDSPRGGPLRFTYASGARPLAGYTIKRGIGRGGFGEVYFAVSDGGKEVALKLIRHNLDIELRGVTHCLNLKHVNLIALYDVKQDEQENTWVVMEYATGESLEDVIQRSPQGLPLEEALDWLQGIAAGVSYLHDHGIVHRDLKPGNVFRDDGQVKLGDYGLSKFISCSRRSGQTESIGTVHYMAPEVANGRYGKEIDIYALGIILFEMLTGHVPFEGESVGEVLMKHLTAEPSLAEVPDAYRAVIARSLAKDPAQRFATVQEMTHALPPLAATMAYRPPQRETRAAAEAAPVGPAPTNPPPPLQPPKPAAAILPAASAVDEEPIWRAIRDGWRTSREYWDGFNTPTKIAVALVGVMFLANGATWNIAFNYGPYLVAFYVVYRVIRSVVMHQESSASGAARPAARSAPQPVSEPPPSGAAAGNGTHTAYQSADPAGHGDWRTASRRHWQNRRGRRGNWREQAVAALVVKSARERMADLAGSLILATAVGAAMSFVVTLFSGNFDSGKFEQFAWLMTTSVAGAWSILIPSKFWEGARGDAWLRRFVLLISGLCLGGIAYGMSEYMKIEFNGSELSKIHVVRAPHLETFSDARGNLTWQGYLAYFAVLLPILRWWRQADPLRSTRLSVWTTAICVCFAWLVSQVFPFPQPWGLMVAAIISTSVQLASPYVPQHERAARQAD